MFMHKMLKENPENYLRLNGRIIKCLSKPNIPKEMNPWKRKESVLHKNPRTKLIWKTDERLS